MQSLHKLGKRAARRAAGAAGAAVLGAAIVSPPASAEQVESWHERDAFTVIVQEQYGDEFCGGSFDSYDVLMEADVQIDGHVVRRGDGEFYYASSTNAATTFTNVETGATFTFVVHIRDADLGFAHDGSSITITAATRGTQTIYVDGVLTARDAGLVLVEFTFDDGGTPDDESDDVFTGPEVLGYAGQFEERDFCEDVHNALD